MTLEIPAYNRTLAGIFFPALSILAIFEFRVAAQEEMPMPPPQAIPNLGFENSAWNFSSQDKYLLVKDSLSLYQIYHLWDISEDGDFTAVSTQAAIRRDWQKPISLDSYPYRTYCIIVIYTNRIVSDSR